MNKKETDEGNDIYAADDYLFSHHPPPSPFVLIYLFLIVTAMHTENIFTWRFVFTVTFLSQE